ncbi:MAG: Flp pilus assembly protein CpaB [Actinomycetota bacterium]
MRKLPYRSSRFYLIVSVVAALLAALSLLAYLQGLRSRIAESGRLVGLVVAARDLGAGEVLDPSSLRLIDFPDLYLLPGTYTDTAMVAGSTLRCAVSAGEPLLDSSLLPRGGGSLTMDALDKGFRAYALAASAVAFPAAELHAGCRVDILAVTGEGAAPLLENVEVIMVHGLPTSAGSEAGPVASQDYAGGSILLQVTGEEACRLAAAQEGGRVELLLRATEGP